jgi:disulfide bond formation protein DsbB
MKIIGSLLVALGGAQIAWAFHVMGASLHMGSPLRIHGQMIVRAGGELGEKIAGMIELGRFGFSLLSTTTWVLAGTGALVMVSGLYLLFQKHESRSRSERSKNPVE